MHPGMPPGPPPEDPRKLELEEKVQQLEKKLEKEHEQVLLASLKSQEEKAIAARVETSIKDIQDKLRRDRREAENEEVRLKLETKITELESRLVQERETWVSTLKNQMASREGQDKEIETHFMMRIQEMERRWLEEKAHWQTVSNNSAEENRRLKEKLEGLEKIDAEYQKVSHDKEALEERVREMAQDKATLQAKVNGASERERDFFQMKADLQTTREQLRISQEKYERDLPAARASAKEREQRLLSDNERLQSELAGVTRRIRAEYESEIRRIRAESEGELKKSRAQADLAGAALQRMRAVGSALEKQVASLRAQATEAKKLKEEMQRINERYKAEFIVLQRKWQDREVEIRKSAEADFEKRLETEKTKIKLRAQEEVQSRVIKVQENLRKDMEGQLLERERALRLETERQVSERSQKAQKELEDMRRKLEDELKRKSDEYAKRDLHWQERQVKSETETNTLKAELDGIRLRLKKEEELNIKTAQEKMELEKTASGLYEKVRLQQAAIDENAKRLDEEERRCRALAKEKDKWEQGQALYEERIGDARARLAKLEGDLAAAQAEGASLRSGKVELQETVAKIEAEHSRQLETWRRKLDLVRRDYEARLKSVEAERGRALRDLANKEAAAQQRPAVESESVFDKLQGIWKKKDSPQRPEPPAPPMIGSV